jgi:hypothetical protein
LRWTGTGIEGIREEIQNKKLKIRGQKSKLKVKSQNYASKGNEEEFSDISVQSVVGRGKF